MWSRIRSSFSGSGHANGSIGPIFNKEKEQKRLQTAQMIGDIGNQVADIARTNGKIAATEAANEKMKTAGGRDAASAAAGAAVGELAGKIAVDGFGKQVSELSEEEKQTVSGFNVVRHHDGGSHDCGDWWCCLWDDGNRLCYCSG